MRYRDQNGQDWADIIDFLTAASWCSCSAKSWLTLTTNDVLQVGTVDGASIGRSGTADRDAGLSQPPGKAANDPARPSARTRLRPRTADRTPQSDPSPLGHQDVGRSGEGGDRAPIVTANPPTLSFTEGELRNRARTRSLHGHRSAT
jgi:hypothetical protein